MIDRIKELLEQEKDVRELNEEFHTKWLEENFDIFTGKKRLTEEMIQEKIDWIYTLADLADLKDDEV